MTTPRQQNGRNNRLAAFAVTGVVAGMVGLSFAAVPLYKLFCQVTGYGGTPKTEGVAAAPGGDTASGEQVAIRVRFDGNVNGGLSWTFQPMQRELEVTPGEATLAFFTAENTGRAPVVGTATFNVTPLKVGQYFAKIDCFCFTEQRLAPGERIDMPVQFYVDPAMLQDDNAKEVRTITLSYTFFRAEDQDGGKAAVGGTAALAPSGDDNNRTTYSGQERVAADRRG